MPQGLEVQALPLADELSDTTEQRLHAIVAPAIQRQGQVLSAVQDLSHQAGEHGARSHLDEGLDARVGHVLNQINETYRVGDLARQAGPHLIRRGLIRCRGLPGPHRSPGLTQRDFGQEAAKGRLTAGHHR